MKNVLMLSAVAVMLVAGSASAAVINLSGTTLTFGYGQDPTAALGTCAQINNGGYAGYPVVTPGGTLDLGNTQIAAFQALTGSVVNFNTSDSGGENVTSVVAQLDAVNSVTFSNFGGTGTAANYAQHNGRGTFGAFSGVNSQQCLGFNSGSQEISFTVAPSAGVKVSSLGFDFSGANDSAGGGRDAGGDWATFTMGDASTAQVWVPYFDSLTPSANGKAWVGYTDTTGTGIVSVSVHYNGQRDRWGDSWTGGYTVDDLSIVTAVPEPATMSLLILGGIGMIGGAIRRRRTAA